MQLLVLGATGGVGRHIVDQALAAGHEVHAVARSAPDRSHERLSHTRADATVPGALDEAVQGVDAVICAIGAGLSDRSTRTTATKHLLAAMQRHDVDRLVLVSSLGAGDSYGRIGFATKAIVKTLLRNAIHDHDGQEAAVNASSVRATILRPGGLSDEPDQQVRTVADPNASLKGRGRVPRAAVARVALQAVDDPGAPATLAILASGA
jgi:uncharacterized protein YbjT (DUF2867 family)